LEGLEPEKAHHVGANCAPLKNPSYYLAGVFSSRYDRYGVIPKLLKNDRKSLISYSKSVKVFASHEIIPLKQILFRALINGV